MDFYKISPLKRPMLSRLKRAFVYKLHRFEPLYWSLYDFQPLLDIFATKRFDLIIANDIETLPFSLKIASGAKVLADLHEYAPGQFEDQFIWRFFFQDFNKYLCATYLQQCDEIITASPGFVDLYKKNYSINPIVIGNETDYVELQPKPVNKESIRIISHGVAMPTRKLEFMIKIMDHMEARFHLDLMLIPANPGYYRRLKAMAARRSNLSIIPPVAREEIIPITNNYDLSFMIFKPVSTNMRYAMSNKFFESLQARLAIVMGTSHQPQAEILKHYGCGIVLDSYSPRRIAAQLNQLTAEQIQEFKQRAHLAAGELTSQKNMEKFGEIVTQLIKPA